MQIIAHKSNIYNSESFLNNSATTNYIDGIYLDIIITKDKKIVVFSPILDNDTTIETIKNSALDNLKYYDILTLEQTLRQMRNSNKKIILNLLPLYAGEITESNLGYIKETTTNYIKKVMETIKQYNDILIYLCSKNQTIIYYLQELTRNIKIGLIVARESLNYVDVDFYILDTSMLDDNIILEQLNRNKEIMIDIRDCDDLNDITKHFSPSNMTITKKSIFDKLQYINNYPDLFYQIYN